MDYSIEDLEIPKKFNETDTKVLPPSKEDSVLDEAIEEKNLSKYRLLITRDPST